MDPWSRLSPAGSDAMDVSKAQAGSDGLDVERGSICKLMGDYLIPLQNVSLPGTVASEVAAIVDSVFAATVDLPALESKGAVVD